MELRAFPARSRTKGKPGSQSGNWRVALRRGMGGRRGLYRELRNANYGVVSEQIDGGDFDGVATGNERCHRDEAFDSKLLTALMKMISGFYRAPDFLLILGDAIDDRDIGFVGSLVQLQVVKLKENAQFVSARKLLAEARADFVGIENELASACQP